MWVEECFVALWNSWWHFRKHYCQFEVTSIEGEGQRTSVVTVMYEFLYGILRKAHYYELYTLNHLTSESKYEKLGNLQYMLEMSTKWVKGNWIQLWHLSVAIYGYAQVAFSMQCYRIRKDHYIDYARFTGKTLYHSPENFHNCANSVY